MRFNLDSICIISWLQFTYQFNPYPRSSRERTRTDTSWIVHDPVVSSRSWLVSDTEVLDTLVSCSPSSLTIISEYRDVWLVSVAVVFDWDESVQYLDFLLTIFIGSDDDCRDLELLLEYTFNSIEIFNIDSRNEVFFVYNHDDIAFLLFKDTHILTSLREVVVK